MKKIACLLVCLLPGLVNAGVISNFNAVYDTALGQLSYNFDLISVDGTSTAGVNQLYFNYNPEITPFNASTSIVSATSTGNTITYNTNDEFGIKFDTLLNTTAINYSLMLDNITTSELASWSNFEIYVNPSFIGGGSLPGSSNYTYGIGTHSEGDLSSVPEPATLALFGIGLAGLGFARKKKKSA